jgi:magnesium transporter
MIKIYYNAKSDKPVELAAHKAGSLVYVENPSVEEIELLTKKHGLDDDLILDGLDPNEAPRIETWEKRVYIYTRFALPETEKQTTSPLLIVYGLDTVYVITRSFFPGLRHLIESGYIVTNKRTQTLLQLLTEINIGYKVRINNVAKRIWRIRSQLDRVQIENKDFISFIDIEEDMNDFLLALEPMNTTLNHLMTGKIVRLFEDDQDIMEDLELSSEELIRQADAQLKTIRNVREAYSTITANNLNRVFKLMTSITILMGIFTLITGIYSMNIALPAAHNPDAFWIILGITGTLIGAVSYFFKKNRWF